MPLYFIEYDVRATNHDYKPLYAELTKFQAVRVLQSLWCFNRTGTSADGLRQHFQQFVHANDALCVMQVDDWATRNALGTPKKLT